MYREIEKDVFIEEDTTSFHEHEEKILAYISIALGFVSFVLILTGHSFVAIFSALAGLMFGIISFFKEQYKKYALAGIFLNILMFAAPLVLIILGIALCSLCFISTI